MVDKVRHTYGFAVDDSRVTEEWLYSYPKKRKRVIFERDGQSFHWPEDSDERAVLGQLSEIVAPTALFVSTAARFSIGSRELGNQDQSFLLSIYRWFLNLTGGRSLVGKQGFLSRLLLDDAGDRDVIIGLLRAADVGIQDIRVKSMDISDAELANFPEPMRREIARHEGRRQRLQFLHKGAVGDVVMELSDESRGTRQLLELAVDASSALRRGGMMTIDEIDASLHPLLTAKLIHLFQSSETNPRGSQIIFTTHDASLLGTFDGEDVLHRDQIWFIEKDPTGSSVLYPLSDFKPRKEGENRQRRYLNGNYGGIPDLSTDLFDGANDPATAPPG